MSDFSLFSLFTAGLACFAPLAAAYTQPTGDAPVGNPISQPGLNSVVPAGDNFTIVWEPTTKGTVTLVLLKGPSTNAVPQYAIVEGTPNDGTYVWEVKDNLAPTDNAMGYGIQLIDDATGQYQYTTQFGISNPDYKAPSSSSSSSAVESATSSSSAVESATTEAPKYATQWHTAYTTVCPYETTYTSSGKTWAITTETTLTLTSSWATSSSSSWTPVGTGASTGIISKPANVTMVAPTGYAPTTVATTSAVYNSPSAPSASASVTQYKSSASTLATSFFGLAAAGVVALLAM